MHECPPDEADWQPAETGHTPGRGKPQKTHRALPGKEHTMFDTYDTYENAEEEQFDETTLQDGLMELISYGYDSSEICWENLRVRTYAEAGVMTYDKGLVITTPDGQEFQLTIIRSR